LPAKARASEAVRCFIAEMPIKTERHVNDFYFGARRPEKNHRTAAATIVYFEAKRSR
jgi:hypothetical protein